MSPELLKRALREQRHTRRLSQRDPSARYPRDYFRPVDRAMLIWLRPALPESWQT